MYRHQPDDNPSDYSNHWQPATHIHKTDHDHHDESADISVVIPLNTGKYKGGGTEFHNYGEVAPLPTGHALIFPSFTHMHKGLPVDMGDRYLLVFWLYDRKRMEWLLENGSP